MSEKRLPKRVVASELRVGDAFMFGGYDYAAALITEINLIDENKSCFIQFNALDRDYVRQTGYLTVSQTQEFLVLATYGSPIY